MEHFTLFIALFILTFIAGIITFTLYNLIVRDECSHTGYVMFVFFASLTGILGIYTMWEFLNCLLALHNTVFSK